MIKYIAEIGINHNGNINIAKQLIDMAVEHGCHAVKFQKRTIDVVYTEEFLSSPRSSPWGTTQREQKRALEFGQDEYERIDEYCRKRGIIWFASAWDLGALKFLEQFKPPYKKIASAMITHLEIVNAVIQLPGIALVSTGGTNALDITDVINRFKDDVSPFVLFHCVSTYPCPDEDCNIRRIPSLMETYGLDEIGYSGHEVGLIPSILAVAAGATWIERHITLDRAMYGSDQSASLESRGLELMIKYCNSVESILGSDIKSADLFNRELEIMKKLRYWEFG